MIRLQMHKITKNGGITNRKVVKRGRKTIDVDRGQWVVASIVAFQTRWRRTRSLQDLAVLTGDVTGRWRLYCIIIEAWILRTSSSCSICNQLSHRDVKKSKKCNKQLQRLICPHRTKKGKQGYVWQQNTTKFYCQEKCKIALISFFSKRKLFFDRKSNANYAIKCRIWGVNVWSHFYYSTLNFIKVIWFTIMLTLPWLFLDVWCCIIYYFIYHI